MMPVRIGIQDFMMSFRFSQKYLAYRFLPFHHIMLLVDFWIAMHCISKSITKHKNTGKVSEICIPAHNVVCMKAFDIHSYGTSILLIIASTQNIFVHCAILYALCTLFDIIVKMILDKTKVVINNKGR